MPYDEDEIEGLVTKLSDEEKIVVKKTNEISNALANLRNIKDVEENATNDDGSPKFDVHGVRVINMVRPIDRHTGLPITDNRRNELFDSASAVSIKYESE